MKKKPTILVCPLDWGIGHATRCVPVIAELIKSNANVIIAADNRPFAFLKEEFRDVKIIHFPGMEITYPKHGNMAIRMAVSAPGILIAIWKENRRLKRLIQEYNIDAVISDNRYGLWSKSIPTVFITHQLFIKSSGFLKFIEPVLFGLNMWFISKYRECWVPDMNSGEVLSGDLSHKNKLPSNFHFIGPLSRFSKDEKDYSPSQKFKYDILVMLSGPEPQRSKLEEIVIKELQSTNYRCVIVQGLPDKDSKVTISESIVMWSHMKSSELRNTIVESEFIISRPGYSTIMDLAVLGKKAILIPTPGQTEQEYLAGFLNDKNIYYAIDQQKFDLKTAIQGVENFQGIHLNYDNNNLCTRINKLISILS